MNRRVSAALGSFLLAATAALAQSPPAGVGGVGGTVTDESDAPLQGTAIVLEGLGAPRSTTSGSQGQYSFTGLEAGAYTLTASLSGFARQSESVTVQAGSTATVRFTLRVLFLEELVASATRQVKTVREAPATVYVVSESMIRERGYNYLFDALRNVPAMDITWMGGLYGPILMPRGLDAPENNKVLLMIDGIVDNILSPGTAQVYMQYSLHNVKRVEIIYGPASALDGANAMAGLINIITKAGEDLEGLRIQAGGMVWDPEARRAGGLGNLALGRSWGEKGKKTNLALSFHYLDTEGPDLRHSDAPRSDKPEDPGGANYYFGKDYIGSGEIGTYMAQARAGFESIGLRVGGHVWEHRGGQGTYGHEGFVLINAFQNKPDNWNFRNATAFAIHRQSMGDRLSNTATGVFRDTRILDDGYDAYFSKPGTGPDGSGAPGDAGSRYFRPDHSFKLDDNVSWQISSKMTLTAGASAEFQKVSDYMLSSGHSFDRGVLLDPGPVPEIDESRRYRYRDYSGYLEHGWDVSENLTLTTGVRLDAFHILGERTPRFFGTRDRDAAGNCLPTAPLCKTAAEAAAAGAVEVSKVYYLYSPYDQTRTTVNPRLGAVYTAGKKLTLKALYGEGFRMPTARELFSVTGSRFSNPDLRPEKIRTAEISATRQVGDKGFVELDTFLTKGRDIVQLAASKVKRPGKTSFLNQFQNVGKPRIYGLDLKAQISASHSAELFGSYSFQVPEYEEIDASGRAHDPDTPSLTDSTDRIPRQARHKAHAGVSLYLLERRLVITPRLQFVGERPGVITSPIQSVPSYTSINLSVVLRDVGGKGLSLQAVGYNLTNEDILDPGFRTANKQNDFPAAHPQPGFHMFFKVGYKKDF